MIIKGFNVVPLVKQTVREIWRDRIPSLAAETAYYFFFSLFPLLLLVAPLLRIAGNGHEIVDGLLLRLSATMPADAIAVLRRMLTEIVESRGGAGVMTFGALLAAWSGSTVFSALMNALNVAYDVSETRPLWKRIVLRIACLLFAGAVVIIATYVFLDGEHLAQWAVARGGLGSASVIVFTTVEMLVAALLMVALGAALYRVLPNLRQRWAHVILCSAIVTALWIVVTLLLRLYVQHFDAYNSTYGTLGGIILMLSWMYYSMFVLLAGGELAAEIHRGTGAVDPERGNVYLGRIVTQDGPGRATMDTKDRRELPPAARP